MIEIREATSKEMKKCIKTVQKMIFGMGFTEAMKKVNWPMIRFISNFGYTFMPRDKGVKFKQTIINGVSGEITIPKEQKSNDILLYFHGGGFLSGSAYASRGYCSMLANYSGCKVVAIDYSLAPENPFPCAVNDCYQTYKFLSTRNPDINISLIGESAGANLSIVTALKVSKDKNLKPVCSVVAHSPVIDFAGELQRDPNRVADFTIKSNDMEMMRVYYKNADVHHPELSPYYDDLSMLPPTFITCDYNEALYIDAETLYAECKKHGIKTRLIEMRNTFHAFAPIGTGAPETLQILKENCEFIKECAHIANKN